VRDHEIRDHRCHGRLIEYADVFKRDRWEVGFKLSGGEKIPAGDEK
jgi:hypothetical protein